MIVPGSVNPLLLRSAAATGYQVSRSLRFNSSDSAYLSGTPASAGNRKTWTWSGWVKRSAISFSAEQHIWGVTGTTNATYGEMFFGTGDTLRFAVGYTTAYGITTTRVFRDPGAWYHIVLAFDATQSTATNKIKLYINGVEETTFSSDTRSSLANQDWGYNNNVAHFIGRNPNGDIRQFNGYLAEIHFIDGQALTPSSFAETNATTGQWVPKAFSGGSYGTNGFKLDFADNSAATAAALGKDTSGNGNNFTPTNLSVTAGAGNDSLVDTPVSFGSDTGVGGEVRGNYCTWNPLKASLTLSNGNLDASGGGGWYNVAGTFGVTSGKWYWEVTMNTSTYVTIGVGTPEASIGETYGSPTTVWVYDGRGTKQGNGSGNAGFGTDAYGASYGAGDVIGVALDMDNGTLTFYKNNTSQGTAFSTGLSGKTIVPWHGLYSSTSSTNFGQRQWAYQAPAGFKALCDTNLPAPVVAKPSTVMDVKLITANNSTQVITGLAFSPDLVWTKSRSNAFSHYLYDTVRGVQKPLISNATNAEATITTSLTSFNSDGFTLGADDGANYSSGSGVAWTWDAGSSTVTNTQGSITSQVRANTSAGFSIVTYTGNGTAGATVGHGLGVAPTLFIVKRRDSAANWIAHTTVIDGSYDYLYLNLTNAKTDSGLSAPTSTIFQVGNGLEMNGSGATYVGYCFAPVAGYSSFGSYNTNGSTDGPYIHLGFRPRLVLLKATTSHPYGSWRMYDSARGSYNVIGPELYPNGSSSEYGGGVYMDFTANGFKIRENSFINDAGHTFIYCAWAESPFQYARAR